LTLYSQQDAKHKIIELYGLKNNLFAIYTYKPLSDLQLPFQTFITMTIKGKAIPVTGHEGQ
jgi:hypothetical protein